ncbi:hypothetical protein B0H65DRAFT_562588, partial [Neurospora tetraspora]
KQQVIQTQYKPQLHITHSASPASSCRRACKPIFAAAVKLTAWWSVSVSWPNIQCVLTHYSGVVVRSSYSSLTTRAPVSQAGSWKLEQTKCPERPSPAPQRLHPSSASRQNLGPTNPAHGSTAPVPSSKLIRRPFTSKMVLKPLLPLLPSIKRGERAACRTSKKKKGIKTPNIIPMTP